MGFRSIRRGIWLASVVSGALLTSSSALHAVPFPEFVDPNPAPGNEFGQTVVALSTGNVVITSPFDDFGGTDAGAVYLFNGATGALISTLRGSTAGDRVGDAPRAPECPTVACPRRRSVTALANGNFVVVSPSWDNGAIADAGAATWGSGTSGVSGTISASNSLVGSAAGDQVGSGGMTVAGVTALANGNYVVASPSWDNGAIANAGAVSWGSGTSGVSGTVSAANSLVGSTDFERVGFGGVTALANGNYVVASPFWDNGAIASAGAVTWGSGTSGVSGTASPANSLVGSTAGDAVGLNGVTALTNGNYVVESPSWDNGAIAGAGAATWGSGTSGVSGTVSAVNSLVGSTVDDNVGARVTPLTNGNYVVPSQNWDNGAIANAGAATWGSGTSGVSGTISAANSLVGSAAGDQVGGATALTNGNYVVGSRFWDNGAIADAGAATWVSGTSAVIGAISAANSLVGSKADDQVGAAVIPLTNGNYVVSSSLWDNGAVINAGAVTWGSGTSGVSGVISAANSLVGSIANDEVSGATALANGNYVVRNWSWDNGAIANAGAVTWGSGTSGVSGTVSAANSLVGSTANDNVGIGMTALANGNYVVGSPEWDNGAVFSAGAATWGSGTSGVSGTVSAANSLIGTTAISGLENGVVEDSVNGTFYATFVTEGEGRVRVGQTDPPLVSVIDIPGAPMALALEGARPNPAAGNALQVAFALPSGSPARLELHDVAGRRVGAREVGGLGAGRHVVNLAEGRRVAPGIYWLSLSQGRQQQRARVAVIR